jgi:hypothetical protein
VFVGYGLNVPERNINDFAGVNLKGAVVVHIGATPKSLPGPLQAHFGSDGGTMADVQGVRRDRHDQHRQSESDGHSRGSDPRCREPIRSWRSRICRSTRRSASSCR